MDNNAPNLVRGQFTVVHEFLFDVDKIKNLVGNQDLTNEQISDIVEVLSANLESPTEHEDEEVDLVADNFNDSFHDMAYELQQQYGNK